MLMLCFIGNDFFPFSFVEAFYFSGMFWVRKVSLPPRKLSSISSPFQYIISHHVLPNAAPAASLQTSIQLLSITRPSSHFIFCFVTSSCLKFLLSALLFSSTPSMYWHFQTWRGWEVKERSCYIKLDETVSN